MKTVNEILSSNQQYMAIIDQRTNSLYSIEILKWTHEYVEPYGEVYEPYWCPIAGGHWTDTYQHALFLAYQELRVYDSQTIAPNIEMTNKSAEGTLTNTIKQSIASDSGQVWVMIQLQEVWFRDDKYLDIQDAIIFYIEDNQLGYLDGVSSGGGSLDINFYTKDRKSCADKLNQFMKMHYKDVLYYISDMYEALFGDID